MIVTVKEHVAEFDDESATLQFTVVVPFGNVEPEDGVHTGVPTPEQLSVAVAVKVTAAALHWPASLDWMIFAGHVSTGACASLIVTVKLQLGDAPAVQVTVVTPLRKVDPETGEQVTVPQLPVVVGAE